MRNILIRFRCQLLWYSTCCGLKLRQFLQISHSKNQISAECRYIESIKDLAIYRYEADIKIKRDFQWAEGAEEKVMNKIKRVRKVLPVWPGLNTGLFLHTSVFSQSSFLKTIRFYLRQRPGSVLECV